MVLRRFLNSSIGKKQLLALSGFFLSIFLVVHLAGNLLILKSIETFDQYAMALMHDPMIIPAEIILAFIFLSHIFLGIKISIENKRARPVSYAFGKRSEGRKSLASSTMIYSGVWILIFLVLHIKQFKYGDHVSQTLGALVISAFQSPYYVVWYWVSMGVVGLHLSHGLWSMFQTWGVNHPVYSVWIKRASHVFGWTIAIGYMAIPIYIFFFKGVSL